MKEAHWMDIRSGRQKGMSYVKLGRKYHMDLRTAKQYTELPQKPEYTISEPRPCLKNGGMPNGERYFRQSRPIFAGGLTPGKKI